jgi:excisionase family DNA binding protein
MRIRLSHAQRATGQGEIVPSVPDASAQDVCVPVTDHPAGQTAEPPPAPPFLSLRDAADWLCVSLPTLKRMIANAELRAVRVGARRKIPASYLSAYVARDILLPSEVSDDEQENQC